MADLGYIVAGYGVTAAALVWYRWWLSRRAVRARALTAALTGRAPRRGVR
ncbi:hypothetical protein [Nocardioides sp.]|nr:hypothetical protein [Nocardioides sp.]MDI6909834.1 hypothetical protein [Nocardioides sp.]